MLYIFIGKKLRNVYVINTSVRLDFHVQILQFGIKWPFFMQTISIPGFVSDIVTDAFP